MLGVNLADTRLVWVALQSFYGIGEYSARRICAKLSIHDQAKVGLLHENEISALTRELSEMTLENDARRVVQANIQHHRQIGSYVGKRHAMKLPVRGQGTRNNAKTAKKLNKVDRRGFSSFTTLLHPRFE